jgi:hypothetical protein
VRGLQRATQPAVGVGAQADVERHGLRGDRRLRDAPPRAHDEREPIALLLAPRLHARMLGDVLAVVGGEHLGARGRRRGESQRGGGRQDGRMVDMRRLSVG